MSKCVIEGNLYIIKRNGVATTVMPDDLQAVRDMDLETCRILYSSTYDPIQRILLEVIAKDRGYDLDVKELA